MADDAADQSTGVSTQPMSRYDVTRRIVALALRRGARGTGSSPAFLDRRTAMQPLPGLSALDAIPWVLVEGIALRAFMPERATLDVNLMIDRTRMRAGDLAPVGCRGGDHMLHGATPHSPYVGLGELLE